MVHFLWIKMLIHFCKTNLWNSAVIFDREKIKKGWAQLNWRKILGIQEWFKSWEENMQHLQHQQQDWIINQHHVLENRLSLVLQPIGAVVRDLLHQVCFFNIVNSFVNLFQASSREKVSVAKSQPTSSRDEKSNSPSRWVPEAPTGWTFTTLNYHTSYYTDNHTHLTM